MGQFDSPSEGALGQLKSECLSLSPVGNVVEKVASIGSKILELKGLRGASIFSDFIFSLKGVAATKDEANLIYFGEALVDDISRLYRLNEEMRLRIERILVSQEFQEAVANATLHITRTNVPARLKRLATVIANGVREEDLEQESLDDMMRSAVVLTERDIELLRNVYGMQHDMLSPENLKKQRGQRTNELQRMWQDWWSIYIAEYQGLKGLEFKNSAARLQAAGLVEPIPKSFAASPTQNDLELLLSGLKFYERLQEIVVQESSSPTGT
jgi:hypothetical protein